MSKRRISIFIRAFILFIVLTIASSTLYYLVYIRTEKLENVKCGIALVESSGHYTLNIKGKPSIYFTGVDTTNCMIQPCLSQVDSVRFFTAGFVSDSVAVTTPISTFALMSVDTINAKLADILENTSKKLNKKFSVRTHQCNEIRYYISTHDTLDEGYKDVLKYYEKIKFQRDSLTALCQILESLKSQKCKAVYTTNIRLCVKDNNKNKVLDCVWQDSRHSAITFIKPKQHFKANYVFSKSVFLIRRLINTRRFALSAVSNQLPETIKEYSVIGSVAQMRENKTTVLNYSSADGSVIVDDKLRFLGLHSNGRFVTSNRISNSLKKLKW